MADPTKPPYKFLDSYGARDAPIFFGRERETEILLADVVLSRLVVLFAKTGTGKTSLINAAVRPELEKRGFETFFVRVQRDPAASAREELLRRDTISRLPKGSLGFQLERVVSRLKRPIVVFFDQFEEFFLYQTRDEVAAARRFIDDVAQLDRNRASGVHIVFSMREDFYVEMDMFRDAIPTIFQSDSSLRLRWFDERQARAAIVGPAETESVVIEPHLVDRLVEDLSKRHGLVEPAQLQIVCHTLWGELEDGRITLDSYRALGAEGEPATIAEQILNRRIVDQFAAFQTRQELTVLERLLAPGVLSTERGTKRVRDVPGLALELDDVLAGLGSQDPLGAVLTGLEQARLARRYARDDLPQVELTHDYLVTEPDRLAELRRSVRNIWPRRVLGRGVSEWDEGRRAFSGQTIDLEEVLERAALEWEREQRDGRQPDHLTLSLDEARVLLHLALHRGLHARAAFELASARGVPAWEIVAEKLRGPHVDDAVNAVAVLAELGSAQAVGLLHDAFARDDVARDAVAALGRVASVEAVDALAEAFADERLGRGAQDALETIARSANDAGARAITVLVDQFRSQLADPAQAAFALEDLGRIEAEAAVAALEAALAHPELAEDAESSLRRLTKSSRADVAERASGALAGRAKAAAKAKPPRPPPPPPPAGKRRPDPAVLETHYRRVAKAMLEGRVLLLLGGGVNFTPRPLGGKWEPGRDAPTPAELAEYLATMTQLPGDSRDLPATAQAVETLYGAGLLYRELEEIFGVEYAPTPVHAFVAALPGLLRRFDSQTGPQLVVTTTYDDALERAFAERGEACDVVFYDASESRFAHRDPHGDVRLIDHPNNYDGSLLDERPTILKLYGDARGAGRAGRSLVITEDDFADFLRDRQTALPVKVAERFAVSHLLYLGYDVKDWSSRFVLDRLLEPQRLRYKSWAIARHPDELEANLWDARDAEVLDVDLGAYVVELERHAHETVASETEHELGQLQGTLESYHETAAGYDDAETAVSALLQLAQVHQEREEYREAVDVCSQAIALAPNDPNVLYERATCNWYAGWYADAVDDFTGALELEPRWAEAYSGRGQSLAEWGEFERALDDLDRAIKAGSGAVVAYARSGKGLALGGLGRFKEAMKEFEQSLRAEPGNAWAYFNRALTYERIGDPRKALPDFRRALEVFDPPLNAHKRETALGRSSARRARAPRVLVTGFEPFGRHTVNSSGEVVRSIEGRPLGGVTPATAVLPVVYGAAVEALADAVARVDPEIVISLGQADGGDSIAVERVARNVSTAEQPDEAGRRGLDVPPVEGPVVYASTLPIDHVVDELRSAGIPAVLSEDAGGYVCNHLFYGLMHMLATERPGTLGGFVHVPCLPEQTERDEGLSMSREVLGRAVEVIVAAVVGAREGGRRPT